MKQRDDRGVPDVVRQPLAVRPTSRRPLEAELIRFPRIVGLLARAVWSLCMPTRRYGLEASPSDAVHSTRLLCRSYVGRVMLPRSVRVLIAEDERRLADAIARGLRREGMAVDLAPDGSDALIKARVVRYDVLVLDRDLPGVHGDDVCRRVRDEQPDTGILMLTAASALEDLVQGLSLGADDYLPKPFRFAELVARIHALARRATPSRPPVLRHDDLELDPARRTLTRAGRPIELARKEFAVLETLMSADGATVSAEELLERVWDEHTDPFTNVVRMTIMTLRRKLGAPPVVETVIGVGYRLI
jgi:two-component system, OmpR family, response regulator VanR